MDHEHNTDIVDRPITGQHLHMSSAAQKEKSGHQSLITETTDQSIDQSSLAEACVVFRVCGDSCFLFVFES